MRFFLVFAIPVAILLYTPALQAPLYLDDEDTIHNFDTLPVLGAVNFIQPGRTSTDVTLWADNRLADLFHYILPWRGQFYFRITTVLMHSLAATLLFGLVFELGGQWLPAVIAGSAFLVHPIQSEAVIYIGQRAEAQAALFIIAAALAYVQFRKKSSMRSLVCVIVLCATAISSKESALIVLPWLCLIEAIFFFQTRNLKWLLYALPVFVGLGLYALDLYLSRPISRTFISWPQYVFSKGAVLDRYLSLSVFPRQQFLLYDFRFVSRFTPAQAAQWSLPVGLLIVGIILVRTRPVTGFGLITFFTLLLPDILVPRGDLIFEYRVYPAFAGLAIAMGSVPKITSRIGICLFAIAAILLGYRTVHRSVEWNDPVRFYEAERDRFPTDSKILTSLGVKYMERGMFNKGLAVTQEARQYEDRLNDYYRNQLGVVIAANLGFDYLAVGKIEEARAEARRAMGMNGQAPLALSLMGTVQTITGDYSGARQTYIQLIKEDPADVDAWNSLKAVLQRMGETDLARIAEARVRRQIQYDREWEGSRLSIPKEYGTWVIFSGTMLLLGAITLSFRMVWNAIAQARRQVGPIGTEDAARPTPVEPPKG